jgi:hypothetical protein
MARAIWPNNGVSTLRDTRLAVGRFRHMTGYGPVQPTKFRVNHSYQMSRDSHHSLNIAIGKIRARSINKNYEK